MTIDYTGNVGIGTTSPAEPLTVLAGVNTGMLLRSETDNNNLIHLGPYGSSAANKERGFMTLSDTGTVTVSLSSYGASYFNAGNVGIGTTSPSTLLTLESNDFVMMNLSRTSTPSNMEIHFSDSGGLTGAIGGGAGADDTGGVYLSGDGSTRDLVINNAGNVGIGTTVPRADLDIYDTAGGHNVLAYFSKGTGTFDHFRINTLAVGADADRVGFELMDGAGGNHNSHYWIDDTGDMYQKIDSPPGSDQDGTVIGSVAFTGTHLYKLKQGLNASEHIGKAVILNNNELELASTPQDKRVVGIIYKNLAGTRSYDSIGNEIPIQKSENGTWLNTEIQDQYAYVASIGDTIQDVLQGMAVTNINGPVEAGDLLVSSSIPGYLMKQDDDIIRSYTVAKAMKDVIFDENGKAEGVYGFLYGG